jgi:hypothetical protein
MAAADPELAAKILLQGLPAAAASVRGNLDYRLVLEDVGADRVALADGRASV